MSYDGAAIRDLVKPDRIHRDLYIDPGLFELEMERIFGRAWVYVGHDSQVAKPGDYIATTLGRQPVVMSRHVDGTVHVLYNRCGHRGAKVVGNRDGNVNSSVAATTAGPIARMARCSPCRSNGATRGPSSTPPIHAIR